MKGMESPITAAEADDSYCAIRAVGPMRKPAAQAGFFVSASRTLHRSGVLQNLVIPEPEHLVSPSLKPGRALIIVLNLIRMLPAVCLDDEPGLVTYQVGDEGTDAVLATELEPFQLPIAQM